MQLPCIHCQATLHVWEYGRHVLMCQRIELGLLADQISPAADARPKGWKWAG